MDSVDNLPYGLPQVLATKFGKFDWLQGGTVTNIYIASAIEDKKKLFLIKSIGFYKDVVKQYPSEVEFFFEQEIALLKKLESLPIK